jgi:hypothetical protein
LILLRFRHGARVFIGCLALLYFCVESAQARDFPRSSKVGRLAAFERPFVRIGSNTFQLAPAARTFDANNRLIQPSIVPIGAHIVYKLEAATGFVHVMWMLAPNEVVNIPP